MLTANELPAIGNPAPIGLSDNQYYRLADLVTFFVIDPNVAEMIDRLLLRHDGRAPNGIKIGRHTLVSLDSLRRAHDLVTAKGAGVQL